MFRRGDDEPEMDVKQFDVGPITAADVEEAISNKLAIINFNQPISKEIQTLIKDNDVRLYDHDVIYKLFDHVETGKICSFVNTCIDFYTCIDFFDAYDFLGKFNKIRSVEFS